mmetsp:Transcript_36517/g.57030  ORF Transcript_36517/g.57030 Transcript_36517/m.57030 type:complete len:142 (-) Transcript_36517:617-1042(-)
MRDDWPKEATYIEQWRKQLANEKFEKRHNLRMNTQPECMRRAYSKAGIVWRGALVVQDWKVTEEDLKKNWPKGMSSVILRGEHDFVTKECVSDYIEGIPDVEYLELRGMAHMAHLEDTRRYLSILEGYLSKSERKWFSTRT